MNPIKPSASHALPTSVGASTSLPTPIHRMSFNV